MRAFDGSARDVESARAAAQRKLSRGSGTTRAVLGLQATAGNAAVSALLGAPNLQRTAGEATAAVLQHIFQGEIKLDDGSYKMTGYHSEAEAGAATTLAQATGARSTGKRHGGIYGVATVSARATPQVTAKTGGAACAAKADGSTFFPATWDRATVTDAIERSKVQAHASGANRIAYGPLPGLDKNQAIRLKKAGATIYPVR